MVYLIILISLYKPFSIYKFSLAKTTLKIDLFIRIKEVVHNVIALCRLLFLNKDQVVSKNKKKINMIRTIVSLSLFIKPTKCINMFPLLNSLLIVFPRDVKSGVRPTL